MQPLPEELLNMASVYVQITFGLLLVGAILASLMRSWRSAGWVAAIFVGAATISAWAVGLPILLKGQVAQSSVLRLPVVTMSLDPLGAAFLMLITGVCLLATIYSIGYMTIYKTGSPGKFYCLLQLFIAAMIGVVCVADWLLFIIFLEIMILISYLLITYEKSSNTSRAGFKYLVITHIATVGLLAVIIVLWKATGSFAFEAHQMGLALVSPVLKQVLLALYLIAFATMAGIFPMGNWLPAANSAAPSGVSAIISGVMIKLGVYGVLRIFLGAFDMIGDYFSWGMAIVLLGILSAFAGGLAAIKENDSKRLLAFSSMSQSGFIFLPIGIAVVFAGERGLSSIAVLGLLAAGFQILNDAVYKTLLFMTAGSVLYSTGQRDLNKVGGLASLMPVTAVVALVGILSLSGLPPTNGFASKWMIYQSLISGGHQFVPLVIIAFTAFFAGLCVVAYSLKFYNTIFLGRPAAAEKEPVKAPCIMVLPQAILAIICLVIGLAPYNALKLVGSAIGIAPENIFNIGSLGALNTIVGGGAESALWNPAVIFIALVICFLIAEIIRKAGGSKSRNVATWYGGEELSDTDIRCRAHGFYSPFNEVIEKIFPKKMEE